MSDQKPTISGEADSNHRPKDHCTNLQSSALPTELSPDVRSHNNTSLHTSIPPPTQPTQTTHILTILKHNQPSHPTFNTRAHVTCKIQNTPPITYHQYTHIHTTKHQHHLSHYNRHSSSHHRTSTLSHSLTRNSSINTHNLQHKYSHTHTHTHVHSLASSLTRSLTHSLTLSLTLSLAPSLIHTNTRLTSVYRGHNQHRLCCITHTNPNYTSSYTSP
ncbi:unnamed protein product [Schistosoma intercalatum]|nr:unnamed protein product [Schistosoma intercalatum]